jgi:hypothetical protein
MVFSLSSQIIKEAPYGGFALESGCWKKGMLRVFWKLKHVKSMAVRLVFKIKRLQRHGVRQKAMPSQRMSEQDSGRGLVYINRTPYLFPSHSVPFSLALRTFFPLHFTSYTAVFQKYTDRH